MSSVLMLHGKELGMINKWFQTLMPLVSMSAMGM
jgi:hypothetical protein